MSPHGTAPVSYRMWGVGDQSGDGPQTAGSARLQRFGVRTGAERDLGRLFAAGKVAHPAH